MNELPISNKHCKVLVSCSVKKSKNINLPKPSLKFQLEDRRSDRQTDISTSRAAPLQLKRLENTWSPIRIQTLEGKFRDPHWSIYLPALEASSYRPSKNGFSKQQNTRGTGQADNIDMFYHREWPEQIGCTKSRVSMALG